MDLKIGERIMERRKEKGMTQEQLAAVLGVSAPAVSKWETDNSYPDITLLCPLARALDTDVDSLLAFEEKLSEEALGQYLTEIVEKARKGSIGEAEELLNRLLRLYPSDVSLKFNAVAMFSLFEMCDSSNEEGDRARWARLKKELCQQVHDSGNPEFFLYSVSMLASMALAEGELDRAEELLKEDITGTGDLTFTGDLTPVWVQLYLKKGERDKALGAVQRQLYSLVGRVQTCLTSMLEEKMELTGEKRREVCRALQQMEESFHVGGGLASTGVLAEVCLREGDTGRALEYLEEMAERLTRQQEPPNPLLFAPEIAPGPEKLKISRELRQVVLHGLKQDACFAPLRGQERFRALVSRLEESLEQGLE